MPSPYPFLENLNWLRYHVRPSLKSLDLYPNRLPRVAQSLRAAGEANARVVFAGDLIGYYAEERPRASPDLRRTLNDADRVWINLEAPIAERRKAGRSPRTFRFKLSEEYLDELWQELALDPKKLILNLANNHIADFGEAGFRSTVEYCEKRGIALTGRAKRETLGTSAGPIAIAAASEWMNFADDPVGRSTVKWNENYLDELELRDDEHLLVFPHWGLEFRHFQAAKYRDWFRRLAQGRNLTVVGLHSHVPGPIVREAGSICFQSLGNFLGLQLSWPTRLSPLLSVDFAFRGGKCLGPTGYRMDFHYLRRHGGILAWCKVEELSPSLREKVQARLSLIYPEESRSP